MAKRILSGEVPLCNAFTDDHSPGRVLAICLSKSSATQKRDTQRAKVIAADGDQRSRRESVLGPGLAFDNEGVRICLLIGRQAVSDCCSHYSRQMLHAIERAFKESDSDRGLLRLGLGTRDSETQHLIRRGLESSIDTAEPQVTAKQQPTSNQKHERQRDLRHHQRVACATSSGP